MPSETLELLPQQRAAEILRTTVRTLERWRIEGCGPPFVRVGKKPLYRPRDLESWLAARTVRSTSEERAA